MIDLYFWPTPNGKKVTIMLEECGLPYRIVPLNIARGDQFAPEFLALSPNNRMPAIVDHEPLGGGPSLSIFESGAILMYLAEKSGHFGGATPRERYAVAQWVMWQMANQGPKTGERGHFLRAAQDPANGDLSYALRRFGDEVNRIYGVLNNQLYRSRYVAGEAYSIADMICYPWAAAWQYVGENIEEFPHVKRWLAQLLARPPLRRAMEEIGKELAEDPATLSPEEQARRAQILQNQRARPVPAR